MTVSDLCVQTHRVDPDRPRPALDGLRLCHGHHRELERLIAELPARYNDLDRAATVAGGGSGSGSHPGIDVDEVAAELRSQIRRDLLRWATYVATERGLLGPVREDPFTVAAWLTIHLDWLAANEYAAVNLLPVLRELTGRSYGIADIPARRLDLGNACLNHTDGVPCEGTVTLVVRGDDWTAHCPVCRGRAQEAGAPYEPQDATPYLRLAPPGRWVTAEDVTRMAALFGFATSPDLLRQWKARGRIIGRVGATENEYDLRSAQKYLMKRATERERIAV